MATSAEAIAAAVRARLVARAEEEGIPLNLENAPVLDLILEAIGFGVYAELLKLDDNTGQIPSVGHH